MLFILLFVLGAMLAVAGTLYLLDQNNLAASPENVLILFKTHEWMPLSIITIVLLIFVFFGISKMFFRQH